MSSTAGGVMHSTRSGASVSGAGGEPSSLLRNVGIEQLARPRDDDLDRKIAPPPRIGHEEQQRSQRATVGANERGIDGQDRTDDLCSAGLAVFCLLISLPEEVLRKRARQLRAPLKLVRERHALWHGCDVPRTHGNHLRSHTECNGLGAWGRGVAIGCCSCRCLARLRLCGRLVIRLSFVGSC
eukprot:5205407-Prymnesium_polylepis.2